jgi:hypothetical protein
MSSIREVVEGKQTQGEDEKIAYSITSTPWGSSPTDVSVVVKDIYDNYKDVTTIVMPFGLIGVTGDKITLKPLIALTRDRLYRVEVKFTVNGNICEPFFEVRAER